MPLTSAIVASLALMAVSSLTRDLEFMHSYHADELPQAATPRWTARGNSADVEIRDGVLAVRSSGPVQRQFYSVGAGAWEMSAGTATIEFRLKCESDDPEDEVFRVQFTDGERSWRVTFLNNRCNGKPVTTGNWDTYKITVNAGKMEISSANGGVIASEIAGTPLVEPPSLLFGTFKASKAPASRSWSLDFIRWSSEQGK